MMTCPHCGHALAQPSAHKPLTPRKVAILRYLERHVAEHGFAPSVDEIASQFEFSSLATVHEHLANMERKGVIRREFNSARGITLLVRSDELGAPV